MTEMEENTESKFEEIINAALKRAWRIINGFEKMSDEDKKILEAYKKKADEEYKVEDTELTQWDREDDVDTTADIAMSWKIAADFLKEEGYAYNDMKQIVRDDHEIRPYDLQLLKEGYEWHEELKKYL